jgi:hypothetical protein
MPISEDTWRLNGHILYRQIRPCFNIPGNRIMYTFNDPIKSHIFSLPDVPEPLSYGGWGKEI